MPSTTPPPASPAASTSALPNRPPPSSLPLLTPASPPSEPDSDSDPLEIFSSSLFTTFNHVVPWHGSPNSLYTFTPPANALAPPPPSTLPASAPLTVRIPPQAITALHADAVWDASLLVANSVCTGALDVRGRRVVELGAGAGLPSLLSARYGAGEAVLTDYDDPDLVENLRRNREALEEGERDRLKVQGFCCESLVFFAIASLLRTPLESRRARGRAPRAVLPPPRAAQRSVDISCYLQHIQGARRRTARICRQTRESPALVLQPAGRSAAPRRHSRQARGRAPCRAAPSDLAYSGSPRTLGFSPTCAGTTSFSSPTRSG